MASFDFASLEPVLSLSKGSGRTVVVRWGNDNVHWT